MTKISNIGPNLFLNDRLSEPELEMSLMCIHGMKVLTYMHDHDGIQLTKSGAFYRKFVEWAVDEFQWPKYTPEELYRYNKVLNESDVMPLSIMHDLLLDAQLIRHASGRGVLTQAGRKVLQHRGRLQAQMFEAFFTHFDFARHENAPVEYEEADNFHFIGVVSNRLTKWVVYEDIVECCLPIHAIPRKHYGPLEDGCYYLYNRLMRPLLWLGLIEEKYESERVAIERWRFRKTSLFDKFLRFELELKYGRTVH